MAPQTFIDHVQSERRKLLRASSYNARAACAHCSWLLSSLVADCGAISTCRQPPDRVKGRLYREAWLTLWSQEIPSSDGKKPFEVFEGRPHSQTQALE